MLPAPNDSPVFFFFFSFDAFLVSIGSFDDTPILRLDFLSKLLDVDWAIDQVWLWTRLPFLITYYMDGSVIYRKSILPSEDRCVRFKVKEVERGEKTRQWY